MDKGGSLDEELEPRPSEEIEHPPDEEMEPLPEDDLQLRSDGLFDRQASENSQSNCGASPTSNGNYGFDIHFLVNRQSSQATAGAPKGKEAKPGDVPWIVRNCRIYLLRQ